MYQALHNSLSNYQKRCNGKNDKNMVVEYLEVQLADGQAVIGTTASQVKTQPTRMIFNLAMILGFDDVINDHHSDKSLKIIIRMIITSRSSVPQNDQSSKDAQLHDSWFSNISLEIVSV